MRLHRRDLFALGLGAVTSLGAWRWLSAPYAQGAVVREAPLHMRVYPFSIRWDEPTRARVRQLVCDRLRYRTELSVSDQLHWLQVFGVPGSAYFQDAPRMAAIGLLTNAEQIARQFGQKDEIVVTESGIRYLSALSGIELVAASRPAHPYQELAAFGRCGLASSTAIRTLSGQFTLRDVLHDCLSNLQLRENDRQQPEFATAALAHYLPPADRWRNRWGEEITLEQWTQYLLERDVSKYCCNGTHLLHSLGLMLQVQARFALMSDRQTQHLRDKCQGFVRDLERSQHSDGAWRADWTPGAHDRVYESLAVHMTGHILEAQLFLPIDLRIHDRAAQAGIQFLVRAFEESTDRQVQAEYCSYSHAGNALLCCAIANESSEKTGLI